MDLFTLSASLELDSSKFNQAAQDAVSIAGDIANLMETAASAVRELADRAGEAGDKIDKQSQKIGFSAEAYQQWDYILGQSGTSIDRLGTFLRNMNSAIDEGDESIEALGLSFEELGNMTPEERLKAVVEAFQGMPDGAEKSALAMETFGTKGTELLPILNGTNGSIEELVQKFNELGLGMSEEQIANAVAYNDAMDNLHRTFDNVSIQLGSTFLPLLTEWAEKLAGLMGELTAAFQENGIEGVIDVLGEKISSFAHQLQESDSPMIKVFGEAIEFVKNIFVWINEHQQEVIIAVTAILAAFAVAKVLSFFAVLNPVYLLFGAIAAIAAVIIANWEGIESFFVNLWNSITGAVQNAINAVKEFLGLDGSTVRINKTIVTQEVDSSGNVVTTYEDGSNSIDFSEGGVSGGHSFAKGNWNVPYDMVARLHRGERVLTASQARNGEDNGSGAIVSAIQGLRNDLNNLKLMVGEKVFGEAVVDYGGRNMSDYIGGVESSQAYGYGT